MRKLFLTLVLCAFAAPAFAVGADDCSSYQQLASLYEVRALMLKPYSSSYDVEQRIARRVEELRGPLPGGGYRWVRWVRPDGDAPIDKQGHTVAAVNGSGSDSFETEGQHPFAVRIVVPAKRSLFNKNSPVYVGTVHVSYTANGRTRTKDEAINNWMNPDTAKTIDLGTIADRAEVALDVSAAAKDVRQALVEVHFRQAVAQDDPANPAYDAIQALEHVRQNTDATTVDYEIAKLERALIPGAEPFPLVAFIADIRKADELMRSKKTDDQEKGQKLLRDALRRIR